MCLPRIDLGDFRLVGRLLDNIRRRDVAGGQDKGKTQRAEAGTGLNPGVLTVLHGKRFAEQLADLFQRNRLTKRCMSGRRQNLFMPDNQILTEIDDLCK